MVISLIALVLIPDKTPLTPNPNLTSPTSRVIRDSILSDLGGNGGLLLRTIQTALNEEILNRRSSRWNLPNF